MALTMYEQEQTALPVLKSTPICSTKPSVVAIVGVGYVGEHLVDVFSASFEVVGYDVSMSRVEKLRTKYLGLDHVRISNEEDDLRAASHFLISVPTTLGLNGEVDLSHISSAIELVERYAQEKAVVVIESTVTIGTTRKLLQQLARSRGVFAGMSPEVRHRENKGHRRWTDISQTAD